MAKFEWIIIDIESYLYQACTACKTLERIRDVTDRTSRFHEIYDLHLGLEYLDSIVERFQAEFNCRDIVMVIGDKGNNFRKDLNPSYKAHRPAKPLMYDYLLPVVINKYNVISLPSLEADDTCRIIFEDNKNFKGEKIIVTIDKDFYSVPCNLYRDNPKDRTIVKVSEEDARINEFIQVIMGDKTDGYSGIPNYGEAKARKFVTKDTTFDDVIKLYEENGLTKEEALLNYNMAHIVGIDGYDLDRQCIVDCVGV